MTLTAVPELGSVFDYWLELDFLDRTPQVEYNSDPIMTLVVERDVRYEASFVSGFIVSATAFPGLDAGTIEFEPDYPGGEIEEDTIRKSFRPGTHLTLTAVPTAGYAFHHWEIDHEIVSTSPYYQTDIEGDLDITAVFTPGKILTMTVAPDEYAGAIEVEPDFPGGTQDGAIRTECYVTGSSVTVTAAPEVGYLFDHWEGDDIHNSTNQSETLTLYDDKSVTAHFIEGKVLTVEIVGEGEVTPEEGLHTYATDTLVTGITATPADGWWFDRWEGDLSGSDSPTSITLDTDKTIRAVFKTNFSLTMAVAGNGTVTPAPGTHTKESGDVVALNAVPDTGWWFHHWECVGDPIHGTKSASTNLTMDGDKTVTAVFVEQHTLSMAVNGEGSVTPAAGDHSYGDNDIVPVSATPADGWRFDRWEGDLSGDVNPTNVTMDADKSVTAVFIRQNTLTIAHEGNGSTTPAAGTYAIDHGNTVALIAAPDNDWIFDRWQGDEYSLNPSLTFEMVSDTSVTAVFRQEFDVTLAAQGSGRLNPAVGTYTHRTNDRIPLAAFPDAGWRFDRWEGGLTGSNNPTTLTVTGETTVTGVFVKIFRIRTAVQGMGTVELAPGGEYFDSGATIQIEATADAGWQFSHWACAGDAIHGSTANPGIVTADRDKTITAVFRKEYTLDLSVQGSGSTTPAAGAYTHLSGDAVNISTASDPGHLFSHWEGDASGSDDPLSVLMNNDKAITAIFLEGYDLTTSVQGQGTIDPTSGLYLPGATVELTATPAENYTLDHWLINGMIYANSGPVTTLVMNEDKNVTAVFDVGYALTATVLTGTETGSVEFNPDYPGGTVDGATRTEFYKADTEVELTAVAEVGYVFDYWEEGGVQHNSSPLYTVAMDSNRSVSVAFAEGTTVTTFVSPDETAGRIEYSPDWPGGAENANVRTETYAPGTEVTLTAMHREGYYFDRWEENGQTVGTDPTYTMTVESSDITLTAVFLPGYTLWMNVRMGEGAFDVYPDYPGGTAEGSYRVETYPEDSIVVLNPLPAEGYAFFNYLVWNNEHGGAEVFEPELTLIMQDWPWQTERMEPYNKKVELQFVPGVTLTATVSKINEEVPGAVAITPDMPGGTVSETEWTQILVPGTEAEVFAHPAEGFRFSHWEGDDIQGNTAPLATLVMTTDKSVEAVFTARRTLKVQKLGEGTVSPSPGAYYYDEDTNVNLDASPAQGWWFDHWSVPGDVNDGSTNAQITVAVDGYKTATAVFKRDFTITVATAGTGSGSVSPPAGNHAYTFLDEVPFTATPDSGSAFSHWQGGLTGSNNPDTLTVTGDATVTAHFVPAYPLNVTIQGSGAVAKTPDLQSYPAGTTVTLEATPDSGYAFDSWSGDVSGSAEAIEVVMDSAKSVTAAFSQGERLSMSVQGRGATTPAPGNHFYSTDQQVTLTATPDSGFDFVRWSSPGDAIDGSTSAQVQITMSGHKTVKALFTEHTLTTAVSNGQTGDTLTPAPGAHTYADGAVVSVQAIAGASSAFSHWEGGLSGARNPATIVMDGDKSVTAVFAAKHTLTLTNTGEGTLTPSVGMHTYPDGKQVSITATPAAGYVFAGWTGDASGNNNPLTVTMDADKAIEARFWNMRKLTVDVVGEASVTLDPYFGNPITPGTGEHYFFFGDTVRIILETGGNGWQFGHWEGDASGTSNRTSVKMDDNKSVTAMMKANLYVTKEGPGAVTPAEGSNFLYAPQEVQLTATPDPGCKFKEWLIIPHGSDISEWYVLDEPNPVLDFSRPLTARATFIRTYGLQISIEGNGSVAIDPEKDAYDERETLTLIATPDENWAFDYWYGDVAGMLIADSTVDVWMYDNRSITAVFIERPGLSDVDFRSDLDYFLLDIGAEEDISTFDGNEIVYDANAERVYVGNGIPDVAELCLIEGILNRRSLDHTMNSGVSHDRIWGIWNTNLVQAEADLPDEDPRIQRVVAGYMTLGDYKSEGFINHLVRIHYNSEGLTTSAYDTNGQRYLYYKYDADNDGVTNRREWERVSPDNDIANIDAFVEAALDGRGPPPPEQTARTVPQLDLFSPEMDEMFAAVDYDRVLEGIPQETGGAMDIRTAAALMTMFGLFEWPDGLCEYCMLCAKKFGFEAYPREVNPFWSSQEELPDPEANATVRFQVQGSDTLYTGARGSRIQIPGGMRVRNLELEHASYYAFHHWQAPGSLLDGSREKAVDSLFIFSNTEASARLSTSYVDVATSTWSYGTCLFPPPGALTDQPGSRKNHVRTYLPWSSRVKLGFWSLLPGRVVFAVTTNRNVEHTQAPCAIVVPSRTRVYRPATATGIYPFLNSLTFMPVQGARIIGSNTELHACLFLNHLVFGDGCPVSVYVSPWPGYEYVQTELYLPGQLDYPIQIHTNQYRQMWRPRNKSLIVKAVVRPKEEYKLDLEVEVTGEGGPGDDCPGYVVVEKKERIGGTIFQDPKRYYSKNAWVRIRPVANPGYRFVRWDANEDVQGVVWIRWPGSWWPVPVDVNIKDLEFEEVAVCMENDTIITAVFEWDPIKVVQLAQGDLPEREIKEEDDPDTPDIREDVATISDAPAMPQLRISLNGGRPDVEVQWRLEVAHEWTRRINSPPDRAVEETVPVQNTNLQSETLTTTMYFPKTEVTEEGEEGEEPTITHMYNEPTFTAPLQSSQPWTPEFDGFIVGGEVTVYVKFCNQGEEDNPITSTFRIWAVNPAENVVTNYIRANSNLWYAPYVAMAESNAIHVNVNSQELNAGTPLQNRRVCGGSDGGTGVMQLTNPAPAYPNQVWSWKANVHRGLSCMAGHVTVAMDWMSEDRDQRGQALGETGYEDYDDEGIVIKNENHIEPNSGKPVPSVTEGTVAFGDSEDDDYPPEDAVAIKLYNGASRPNDGDPVAEGREFMPGGGHYWSWKNETRDAETQDLEDPGYWVRCEYNINGHNYVATVCGFMPQDD